MKKNLYFTLILLFGISLLAKAQVGVQVVNDPTNLAKIKEVLEAGREQIAIIKEQTSILKDVQDGLKTVNRSINTINTIKRAIEQQAEIVTFFSSDLLNVPSNPMSTQAMLAYVNRIEAKRTRILNNNSYLLQLLADNVFHMSDYERLKAMQDIIDENNKTLYSAQKENEKYEFFNKHLGIIIALKEK